MDIRGKLWIIPSSEIADEVFERNVPRGLFHTNFIQEFCDKYNLGFFYVGNDYQKSPCDMARIGNLVIKSDFDEKTITYYIPNSINDKQMDFINGYAKEISEEYNLVLAYYNIKEYEHDGDHAHSIDEIIEVCNEKYNGRMK